MNLNLGFRGSFHAEKGQKATLKITASTLYRLFINGEFVGSGPARTAHGYFRVDEYDLGDHIKTGNNIVAIEVAGYNINTYYTLDQPSFLLSEVNIDGKVVLATGNASSFEAFQLEERLQKVERYSFQRPFTEYYRMKEGYDKWRYSTYIPLKKLELSSSLSINLLPRNVLLPDFLKQNPVSVYLSGTVKKVQPEKYYKDRSLVNIGKKLKGYKESELETPPPSQEIQEIITDVRHIINKPFSSQKSYPLKTGEFYIFDFGINRSGFLGAKLVCPTKAKVYFYFDELLTEGDVNTKQRMADINNQIVFELEPGTYNLESFESYTCRYLKIIAVEGDCRIDNVYLREFAYPENKQATFTCNNYKLNAIYNAAKETFRQNAVDVFTDCPSRERAGWLCDSYFAGIMEREFTGHADVAHNFYENYALPEHFEFLPEGMVPMCYPADHNDGIFIPNWSLWFILQVDDYAQNGGDPRLIAQLKPRIEKLLQYFARFENSDGLLENLESWVFIEWSKSSEFVQDVNYPSNMLYVAALKSAARLYNNGKWKQKAEKIRQTILRQSFNGEFFVDNAVRENEQLKVTENTTEVCQYYAFFFDIATPESHPELWKKLTTQFGPNRNDSVTYPKVFRANAFMGNYMRMDLLSRYGLQSQILFEIQDYFFTMADLTGTLWEHMGSYASCNHGFASYIGHVLYRDILGISKIDYRKKVVNIRFSDIVLNHCSGTIPVGGEKIGLKWTRSGNNIEYSLQLPEGYKVKIENESSAQLCERNFQSLSSPIAQRQENKIPLPTEAQLRWHNYERVMFVHYGPAAWQGREYDNFTTPLDRLKIPDLNTDQWCEVARSWGAGMVLFVAKHCGGFCWWQTETSDYGVKEIPWRNGKGDVLKNLSESCKKYGLDLGIYIYPGDDRWGAGIGSGGITQDPSKQEAYNKVFRTQLIEVLTQYGPISEVWFDGNCCIPVKDILDKYASNSVIFQGEQANLRWVGNEDGYAPYPNWYTIKKEDLTSGVSTALHSDVDGDCYAPVEVDVPLLKNKGHKWFWAPGCDTLLMTQEQLMNLYYKSVGRGSVLLLNSTPDTTGVIPHTHAAVYQAFGKEIENRFAHPLKQTAGNGDMLELEFSGPTTVNHCILQEDLSGGQRVLAYQLEGYTEDNQWIPVYKGSSIGNKKIDHFPSLRLKKLRVHFTQSKATPRIKNFSAFHVVSELNDLQDDRLQDKPQVIETWSAKTFNPDRWTEISLDLTPYVNQIGEYEIVFSRLATDYLSNKSSDLEFKDPVLFMYGEKQLSSLALLPKKHTFRITRSQQTLDEFPTTLNVKVKNKGASSIGEITIKRLTY
ncbi:alpha-L-fucosidase [Parabacteroides sp. TM07-1AC]|uniref:alpha-L-fucosidase n=1 Tax=Parabacteroides sp. TM07-1AC TaxID=2292363 RepID=UPI001314CC0C|nr:alpha-L-fucosidase [Parabacteroides sp. TM07-1AC]